MPVSCRVRSGREVAVVDRAALELERADAPADRLRGGAAAPGAGSPPSFDQLAVPSGLTTSRTVASETEIVSTSETSKMLGPGNAQAQPADRDEGLVAEPGRLRDREPADVDGGRREEPEAERLDRRRQPRGVLDPARDHPARERRARADPQDGEGRQRDERDGGRDACVASFERHPGFYLSGRRR